MSAITQRFTKLRVLKLYPCSGTFLLKAGDYPMYVQTTFYFSIHLPTDTWL